MSGKKEEKTNRQNKASISAGKGLAGKLTAQANVSIPGLSVPPGCHSWVLLVTSSAVISSKLDTGPNFHTSHTEREPNEM